MLRYLSNLSRNRIKASMERQIVHIKTTSEGGCKVSVFESLCYLHVERSRK